MSRIMKENFFIRVNFQTVTQAESQFKKIEEAIDAVIDKFSGKDYIVDASCYDPDDEPIPEFEFPVETDPDDFFDNYRGDNETNSKSSEAYKDEKHKALDVFIEFIGTRKGRAQLEKMKKAFDAELDKFQEKGLIASHYRDRPSETDATGEYLEAEIQKIQKVHNVKIRRWS